jgi:hypothetical protein
MYTQFKMCTRQIQMWGTHGEDPRIETVEKWKFESIFKHFQGDQTLLWKNSLKSRQIHTLSYFNTYVMHKTVSKKTSSYKICGSNKIKIGQMAEIGQMAKIRPIWSPWYFVHVGDDCATRYRSVECRAGSGPKYYRLMSDLGFIHNSGSGICKLEKFTK